MRINHNIAALNTHRQLNTATTNQSKSMEKLSSGLRINKAGDDAAGLAISEKMRGQIRGLDQAGKNAQDGISMIATAEGALNETHDILQRMRELAVQAGNDTNVDGDRDEIQKEINQLTSEINRIGNTTEFNTKKLLNGAKEDVAVKANVVGSAATTTGGTPEELGKYSLDVDAAAVIVGEKVTIGGKEFVKSAGAGDPALSTFSTAAELIDAINNAAGLGGTYTASAGAGNTIELTQKAGTGSATAPTATNEDLSAIIVTEDTPGAAAIGGTTVPAVPGVSEFNLDVSKLKDGQKLSIGTDEFTFKADGTGDFKDLASLATAIDAIGNHTTVVDAVNGKVTLTQVATKESAETPQVSIKTGDNFNASLQIGANENQSMTITINDMRASALGITGTGDAFTSSKEVSNGTDSSGIESGLDISSAKSAAAAITKIQTAIDTVSAERSKLGANQNRLEHTINNLGTSSENLTAAESRVRDVDMAKEMMEQTKNSILAQASQAMLAQANQLPQGVLQLLR